MAFDYIQSHRKPGLQHLSEKFIFGKSTGGSNWPQAFLGLIWKSLASSQLALC